MTGSVLEVDGVTHVDGDGPAARTVLQDVTVQLEERRVGVIGENGSGKSTFARLLNGLVLPTAGSVRVNGLDTRKDARAVRRQVGFCFTNPDAQIVMPTVREDVAFSLRRRGLSRQEIDHQVEETLSRYGLADHADHPAHLLSGGQKQLLALAAVLVTEPSVLVLDEPTTLLDMRNAQRVGQLLEGLELQVVLVTHDLDLLRDFHRVLVFDEGRLVCDGTPDQASSYYRRLMDGPPIEGGRTDRAASDTR
jgi:biotin transport system ATP-binding protein